ncbi:hypothetical protein [Streptomyces triticirhizae]|uniref:Uncharacterized protein n=1 Tax=Streptomyces triticirhizae TaxID=2483353 RepID=A0A3M2M9K3_9ACTN|nr:hypothetical protein [Streptomyces triticirhizae]RMI46236.1 hypothetical protein EBN88_01290 [Streptomyces triticirhizae]
MKQITAHGRPPRVPAINCGSTANSARLDRHLSVLGGPAVPAGETEEATTLMRELTRRDHKSPTRVNRTARVLLFAPLRRLRRTLFGGRG